jgi:hypothetical protein
MLPQTLVLCVEIVIGCYRVECLGLPPTHKIDIRPSELWSAGVPPLLGIIICRYSIGIVDFIPYMLCVGIGSVGISPIHQVIVLSNLTRRA